jgi:hypothetical protein
VSAVTGVPSRGVTVKFECGEIFIHLAAGVNAKRRGTALLLAIDRSMQGRDLLDKVESARCHKISLSNLPVTRHDAGGGDTSVPLRPVRYAEASNRRPGPD